VKRFSVSTLSFNSFFAGPLPTFQVCEAKKRRPSARASFSDSEMPLKTNVIDLTEEEESMAAARKVSQGKKEGKEKAKNALKSSKAETKNLEKPSKAETKNSERSSKAEKLKKKETGTVSSLGTVYNQENSNAMF